MENIPDTALGRMYREHIKLIKEKNIEQLLDQYTDDCLLISSIAKEPLYYQGREQLREHMNGILGIDDLDTDIAFWAETENPQTLMIVSQRLGVNHPLQHGALQDYAPTMLKGTARHTEPLA